MILVTHDIREACRIADRLALVDHGRLIQWGLRRTCERPANDFVRSFFQEAGRSRLIGRRTRDGLGLLAERAAFLEATAAHLDLVGEAILAVLIGVPLGILASRSKAAERSSWAWPTSCRRCPASRSWGSC